MAKIFKSISKAEGLQRIYASSSLNNTVPYGVIRDSASPNGPTSINLVANQIRRIEPIYELLTTQIRTFVDFNLNTLRIVPPVRKINRPITSTIYDKFSTNNPYLNVQTPILPVNGTLIEIKPYSVAQRPTNSGRFSFLTNAFKDTDELSKTYAIDTSTMQQESRTLPLISGPRDERRFFRYMKSPEGLSFLIRQQTLQGGNTFKQSRRYNPLSVTLAISKYASVSLSNPLERVDRALSLGSQSTSKTVPQMIEMSDIAGRLQQESVVDKQGQLRIRFVGGQQNGSNRRTLIGQVVGTAATRLLQTYLNKATFEFRGKKINVGQLGRKLTGLSQTLDLLNRAIDIGDATLKKDQTAYDGLIQADLWPLVKDNTGTIQNFHINKKNYIVRAQKSLDEVKVRGKLHNNFFTKPYPDIEEDYRSSETYTDDIRTDVGEVNGVVSGKYVKDPMNLLRDNPISIISTLDGQYQAEDFIKFKIVVPGLFDEGISCRAFIEDLKQEANGEYEEQRYVGRPERFVVYKGMNRSLQFVVYLVAFSKEELSGMWARANMLNKLVYPIDTLAGHMTPPVVRLTIGNVIQDQPGYFTRVNADFDKVPWDIDAELTQMVKLSMNFSIIEKNMITQSDITPMAALFAKSEIVDPGLININIPGITDVDVYARAEADIAASDVRYQQQLTKEANDAIANSPDLAAKAYEYNKLIFQNDLINLMRY